MLDEIGSTDHDQSATGQIRKKNCDACGALFDCYAGGCWCTDVPLTGAACAELRARYRDCLCPSCLHAHRSSEILA